MNHNFKKERMCIEMRKWLLLMAVAMSAALLMSTTAFAAPLVNSATEPPPEIEIDDPNVPLGEDPDNMGELSEIDDPNTPLGEDPDDAGAEIDDPDVPLGDTPGDGVESDPDAFGGIRSPQTGVTGLTGTECMALLAAAFAVSGGFMLAKARKQAC